jgi:thiol-disulfide isomerase/thioredoxin
MRTHQRASGFRARLGGLVRVVTLVCLAAAALAWLPACASKTAPVTRPAPSAVPAAAPVKPAPVPAAAPTPAPAAVPAPAASAAAPAAAVTPRPPAPAPLVGPVTRTDLESFVTWKELRAQDYAPDPAAVKTIGEKAGGVTVLAIVATWCPDSKREVPRFFKIADQAKFPLDKVTFVAVDRSKKDVGGLTEKHAVTRVPTFVFFRGGQEIGRFVEKSTTALEIDIATILAR